MARPKSSDARPQTEKGQYSIVIPTLSGTHFSVAEWGNHALGSFEAPWIFLPRGEGVAIKTPHLCTSRKSHHYCWYSSHRCFQSLLACFPVVRSHKPPRQYLHRRRVGLFDADASINYRPSLLKALPELRLGGMQLDCGPTCCDIDLPLSGCPNTITQSHEYVVIAANVHGADSG
jgi:hypothetical protein